MGVRHPKVKFSDFKGFTDKQKEYEYGVMTLNLNSWEEYHKVTDIFSRYDSYYWRGQREDWPLKSSFDRGPYKEQFIQSVTEREKVLYNVLHVFKARLSELKKVYDINNEDEIWAYGQHYGLPTPLLDWTTDLYIAAYFALFKKSTTTAGKSGVV